VSVYVIDAGTNVTPLIIGAGVLTTTVVEPPLEPIAPIVGPNRPAAPPVPPAPTVIVIVVPCEVCIGNLNICVSKPEPPPPPPAPKNAAEPKLTPPPPPPPPPYICTLNTVVSVGIFFVVSVVPRPTLNVPVDDNIYVPVPVNDIDVPAEGPTGPVGPVTPV
jgi:hypothetical protein